jgi:hypothetical protein
MTVTQNAYDPTIMHSDMWDVDVEETTTLLSLHGYLLSLCTDGSVF